VTCNETKEFSNFNKRGLLKSGQPRYQSSCRFCQNIRNREHYKDNKDAYKSRSKERRATLRSERMKELFIYLESHSCIKCGETGPIVLEFNHIDPSTKRGMISDLILGKKSLLLEEIAKCEILCCNCHRRVTAKQCNWYSYMGV